MLQYGRLMRLFLDDGPSHVQLLPRSEARDFRDVAAAREYLRPLVAANAAAVRTALAGSTAGSRAVNDADLLDELAERVVSDGLLVISCAEAYFGALGAAASAATMASATTPLQDEDAAAEEKAASQQPADKHWIEIELLDDSGLPVANERYVIELPDGSMITGYTGSNGKARVDDVDPGTAKVSFPALDKAAYEPQ